MKRALMAALIAGGLLAVACGAVGAVSWTSAQKLVHPARSVPAFTPHDVDLEYEAISLATADGLTLAAWWMPAADPRGTVLFLHGYGDSKNQSLELAPFLHDAGYHVLAFDMRAHGESGGDHTTVGLDEVGDAQAAIRYATARDPAAAEHLALVGFSMGASTAINAATNAPTVDAIIADSAFATLTNIASNSITHFTDLPKYPFGPLSVAFASVIVGKNVADNAPVRAVATLTVPVLVIQGLADDIARPEDDGKAIAAAAPAGSELWLVPGAAHVAAHTVAPEEYELRVLAFLAAHL